MWVNKFKPTKQITQIKNGHYSPELWNRLCKLKINKEKTPTNKPGVEAGGIHYTEILFTIWTNREIDTSYNLFCIINHQYYFAFHSVHIGCIFLLALWQGPSLFFRTPEKSLRGQCPYRQFNKTLPSRQMYSKRKKKSQEQNVFTNNLWYTGVCFLFNFNDLSPEKLSTVREREKPYKLNTDSIVLSYSSWVED